MTNIHVNVSSMKTTLVACTLYSKTCNTANTLVSETHVSFYRTTNIH